MTLVGKGVVFDTGGLDIKPPANMLGAQPEPSPSAAPRRFPSLSGCRLLTAPSVLSAAHAGMKKDMGGAGAVLSLAAMIMSAKLPVRLRVLVPAVENSIDGNAFRPSDVIKSRKVGARGFLSPVPSHPLYLRCICADRQRTSSSSELESSGLRPVPCAASC